MSEDLWRGAWPEFEALRAHPPSSWDEAVVGRYNKLLKELGHASGLDFSRFLVPDDELKPEVVAFRRPGYSGRGGSVTYSKTRYCDKQAMAQRLTAVTTFIASFQPLPARPTMGFQPPD